MASKLPIIVRRNQHAIYRQVSERLSQFARHDQTEAGANLQSCWTSLLDVLLYYWEQGEEEAVRNWAAQQAKFSVQAGDMPTKMLHVLHHTTAVIRSYLSMRWWRWHALMRTLTHLEESMRLMHSHYLKSYEALWQQQRIHDTVLKQQFDNVVEHVPEGILILDADFRVTMANSVGRNHLSVLADTGIGDILTSLGSYPIELMIRPTKDGSPHQIESPGKSSQVFKVEVHAQQTHSALEGWILVLHDMTEAHQVQQRRQQQARQANIEACLAGVVHDFNNLLSGTISLAQSLQVIGGMPKIAQEHLTRIVELGKHGSDLVQQMLNFSPTSNNMLAPLNLNAFLSETCEMLKHVIPEQVYFFLAGDAGAHRVQIDAEHLQQALMNLVVNAVDAMPNGGKLRLGLSRFTCLPHDLPPCPGMPVGEWVVLTVMDTGMGISVEALPHVFESFFTTKPPGNGTGLGLAQVHRLIKQYKGYMRLESREGEGTTVFIYLPAVEASPIVPRTEREDDIPSGHGEMILLVDDELIVREGSKALLEYLGYQVLTANDGEHALEIYRAHQDDIALVLIDMVMPKIDGIKLFQRLQALNPAVLSVMMTGDPLHEERQQFLRRGIVAWVQKPLDLAILAQTIQRSLMQHAATHREQLSSSTKS